MVVLTRVLDDSCPQTAGQLAGQRKQAGQPLAAEFQSALPPCSDAIVSSGIRVHANVSVVFHNASITLSR